MERDVGSIAVGEEKELAGRECHAEAGWQGASGAALLWWPLMLPNTRLSQA